MIIIVKQGTAETTLAAGPARTIGQPVGPDSLSVSGSLASQLREFLRAPSAKAEDRGNGRSGVSFSVHYEFANLYDAEVFGCTHAAEVQRGDELRFVISNPSGGTTSVRVPNAIITDVAPIQRGVSVSVSYTAIGGKAERVTI